VRALAGRRDAYRPLETPLAASSAPEEVAAGFLRLHPFETLYIADLDAIEGRGDNLAAVGRIAERFPGTRLWLDAGARASHGDAPWENVIGSESLVSDASPPDLSGRGDAILSLDFRGEEFLGPSALFERPALWPRRVIVMTLARIGLGQGPDVERLARVIAQAGGREIYAAGGVRDARDLENLARIGVAGALVASSLHDGRLAREAPTGRV
jgi:phosphoribosylformimino-5-aminoimidazole carboxamide ribotide isomerase